EANKTQYFCSLKTEQKQPECLFICSWKTCFSNLVRRNFEAKCFSYFMESLILAQDERWRRAEYMQVERGKLINHPSGGLQGGASGGWGRDTWATDQDARESAGNGELVT